ncbi:metallophosphoesterase family protein [Verrucomicrobiaceae bacterium 227]
MRFITLLFLTSLFAAADPSDFVRAPYLQMANHESIHVVWRTSGDSTPRVRYGKSVDALNSEVPADQILTRRHPSLKGAAPIFKDAPVDTHQFEASITGLTPATTYYYAVYNGDTRLTPADKSYRFKTHPVPGTDAPLYFWVVGDSGTGGRDQAAVHTAMVNHNATHGKQLDLYLHVGDMAYGSGTNQEFNERFFPMYEPTLRNTVCWASMGNHEGRTSKGASGVGPFYDAYICPTNAEAGGLASGKEAFYSFDFGRVHFICLDSHDLDRRPSGEMAQWLKADLEKTKADFLVAFFHHPPYTKGSHDSDKEGQLIEMREHIMPILESGGVDVVYTGHSHIYERSMLIDGAYHTPTISDGVILDDGDGDPKGDGPYNKSAGLNPNNGVVQVVAGHGGTGLRRVGTSPVMKRIILEHGSCLISVSGDTLTSEMLNKAGNVSDTFSIVKKGVVKHAPLLNPWQPEPLKPARKPATPKRPVAPKDLLALIPKNANWSYLGGAHPAGAAHAWAAPDYDVSTWKIGKAGFGFGDNDDTTELKGMFNKYKTLYVRSEFKLPAGANPANLGLSISYDDAFIVYINGHEILREGVGKGSGANATDFTLHEAQRHFDYFPLDAAAKFLKTEGKNVIAIEGHNANIKSSDFTLHPSLLLKK